MFMKMIPLCWMQKITLWSNVFSWSWGHRVSLWIVTCWIILNSLFSKEEANLPKPRILLKCFLLHCPSPEGNICLMPRLGGAPEQGKERRLSFGCIQLWVKQKQCLYLQLAGTSPWMLIVLEQFFCIPSNNYFVIMVISDNRELRKKMIWECR